MEHKNRVIRPEFEDRKTYTAVPEGNAVRKAVPYLDEGQKELERRQRERQKRWERQIHRRAIQEELRRRKANASMVTLAEAAVIGVVAAVLLASCVFYVTQLSKQSEYNSRIASLKKEYSTLVESNKARESSIGGEIDYEWIYNYATKELNMSYPEKGQTVTYKKDAGSYVKQGEDIPDGAAKE